MQSVGQACHNLHLSLQKLMGLHRQMMETIRMERESLLAADIKGIEEATRSKQLIIEGIRLAENDRIKSTSELSVLWKKKLSDLTLPVIFTQIQTEFPKTSEQLRTAYNALTIMIKRITEQNQDNFVLVQNSLTHIHEMKKNVLSETVPKSNTYNPQGQKQTTAKGARLISKEI